MTAAGRRFYPIGTKLACAVVGVLLIASVLAAASLAHTAKRDLIEAKAMGGAMVSDLFALTVASAVDFGDPEGARSAIDDLFANQEIIYAAVWTPGEDTPMAARQRDASPAGSHSSPPATSTTRILADRIELSRPVAGIDGNAIGVATLHFTLEPENREYAQARARIVLTVGTVGVVIALLVIAFTRWQVVRPLNQLVAATRKLKRGELSRVQVRAHDEIGRLAKAFNAMAATIVDRAVHLKAANERVQQLLDHMDQAIVVFKRGGILESERSRQADRFFGMTGSVDTTIQDVLYDESDSGVERQAFEAWLAVVFDAPAAKWSELAELAPSQVICPLPSGEEQLLRLQFRPIVDGDRIAKVMLLATDETEKRRLEREVQSKEAEHSRQMTAMRRLLAGGGQLLVSMLESSRASLEACERLLREGRVARPEIDTIFRRVHTIKGESRVLDLPTLERTAAVIEDNLSELRSALGHGDAIDQDAISRLLGQLHDMGDALADSSKMVVTASPIGDAILDQITVRRSDVAALRGVQGRYGGQMDQLIERVASRPFGESTMFLVANLPLWAERLGRRATLSVEGRDAMVPPRLSRVLPGALTHLARNAVAHGIEDVEVREESGKQPVGAITMAASSDADGNLQITITDDGRGINFAVLRVTAVAQGADVSGVEDGDLPFLDGVSTAEVVGSLAGRGMGMAAVREDLRSVGYDIRIERVAVGTRMVIFSTRASSMRVNSNPEARDLEHAAGS